MPSTALKTVSSSRTIPVPYCPSGTMLPTPATSSTICIGSRYCRTKARQRGSVFDSANRLGPYFSARAATSPPLSPRAGSTSIEAATSSAESSYQAFCACGASGMAVTCAIGRSVLRRGGRGGDRIGCDALRRLCFELLLRLEGRRPGLVADRRVLRVELDERVQEHRRDGDAQEPLVVGRNDVPRSMFRARRAEHLRERCLVLVPVLALLDVVRVELPVLLGEVDAP